MSAKPLEDILEKDDFSRWLVGFIDGEGHFGIHRQLRRQTRCGEYFYCRFTLTLRGDDEPILQECCDRYGGRLYWTPANGAVNPKVRWEMVNKAECRAFADLLADCRMRSRKARDFEIWHQAVGVWEEQPSVERTAKMRDLHARLLAARVYGVDE
jgi:hypothetical protein